MVLEASVQPGPRTISEGRASQTFTGPTSGLCQSAGSHLEVLLVPSKGDDHPPQKKKEEKKNSQTVIPSPTIVGAVKCLREGLCREVTREDHPLFVANLTEVVFHPTAFYFLNVNCQPHGNLDSQLLWGKKKAISNRRCDCSGHTPRWQWPPSQGWLRVLLPVATWGLPAAPFMFPASPKGV